MRKSQNHTMDYLSPLGVGPWICQEVGGWFARRWVGGTRKHVSDTMFRHHISGVAPFGKMHSDLMDRAHESFSRRRKQLRELARNISLMHADWYRASGQPEARGLVCTGGGSWGTRTACAQDRRRIFLILRAAARGSHQPETRGLVPCLTHAAFQLEDSRRH